MNESMLYDLYFGEFRPWERERIRTPEYDTITRKISAIDTYFEHLPSPEESEKFKELQDLRSEASLIEDLELFKYAFCAGARLMIDIFTMQITS